MRLAACFRSNSDFNPRAEATVVTIIRPQNKLEFCPRKRKVVYGNLPRSSANRDSGYCVIVTGPFSFQLRLRRVQSLGFLVRSTLHPMIDQPHLLISDDDRDFRETLDSALASRGFRTSLAENGQQALELIRTGGIHLALLDYHMPKLTGLEVIQQVRATGSPLPCILISAGLTDEIIESAERQSVFSILRKPISVRDLTVSVHAAFERFYQWTPRN